MQADTWVHRSALPRIHQCFNNALLEWAEVEYPLCMPPVLVGQFAHARFIVTELCMKLHDWEMQPPATSDHAVISYAHAVEQNISDDTQRAMKEREQLKSMVFDDVSSFSDGQLVPAIPDDIRGHRPRLFLENCTLVDNLHATNPNPTSPQSTKRERDSVGDPAGSEDDDQKSEAKRARGDVHIEQGHEEFSRMHHVEFPSGTNPLHKHDHYHINDALRYCMSGWPAYQQLYGRPNNPHTHMCYPLLYYFAVHQCPI